MTKTILLMRPHLDVNFKADAGHDINRKPDESKAKWPRNFYLSLYENLEEWLINEEYAVARAHFPMCHLTPKLARSIPAYATIMMHRQDFEFDHHPNTIYLKDTPFPDWFSFDTKGWGGTASFYPFDITNGDPKSGMFEMCQEKYIKNNWSKFKQPAQVGRTDLPDDFIFWPCQLPHDQTLKYHARLNVHRVLTDLVVWCHRNKKHLVVKRHPVPKPGNESMRRYQEIVEAIASPYIHWIENISVHECLHQCSSVYLFNSGTGFEALLHEKPVVTFGDAEYDCISVTGEILYPRFNKIYDNLDFDTDKTKAFFDLWFKVCIKADDQKTFGKLIKTLDNMPSL